MQNTTRQKWILTETGHAVVSMPWWASTPPAFLPRYANHVTPMIDGKDYMAAVADAMASAKTRIWLTAWDLWLDVPLKREPIAKTITLRQLLEEKKGTGVDIRVLLSNALLPDGLNYLGPTDRAAKVQDELQKMGAHVLRSTPGNGQLTSEHQKSIVIDDDLAFLGGIDLAIGRWDYAPHELTTYEDSAPFDKDNSLKRGAGVWDTFTPDHFLKSRPRLPWHDLSVRVEGPAARDVARNFVQRWNGERAEAKKNKDGDPSNPDGWPEVNRTQGQHTVQIVRTLSLQDTNGASLHSEQTIDQVYCQAIANARHSIYIEQQYFIGSTTLPHTSFWRTPATYVSMSAIKNKVALTLVERICQAIDEETELKVILVLPVLGSESLLYKAGGILQALGNPGGTGLKAVANVLFLASEEALGVVTRNTLRFVIETVAAKLISVGRTAEEVPCYFLPVTLRRVASETVENHVLCEQIYVHSKMMIVDDLFVTIGSANVNDRGLLVGKDSEINAVVIDSQTELGTLGGQQRYVRPFARKLRKDLWEEHFGVHLSDDPVAAYQEIKERIRKRTKGLEAAGLKTGKNTGKAEHVNTLRDLHTFGNAVEYPVDLEQSREMEFLRVLNRLFPDFITRQYVEADTVLPDSASV